MEQDVNGNSNGQGLREKIRLCPHCGKPINIKISVEILDIGDASDVAGNLTWKAGLTDQQVQIIESAKERGLLAIFEKVIKQVVRVQTPKNIEKFFLTFLQTAVPKTVPKVVLNHYIRLFNKAKIEFWFAQGIGMILADGCIRAIIPQEGITGKGMGVLGKSRKRVFMPADLNDFDRIAADESYYLTNGQWVSFSVLRHNARAQ